MTTKRKSEIEKYRDLENFLSSAKKLNQEKNFRFKTGAIELQGYKNESKKHTVEKKLIISILKSIKHTAINSNLQLGQVLRPGEAIETYRY